MTAPQTILIFNRVPLSLSPYHEWLDPARYTLFLLTAEGTMDGGDGADGAERSAYAEVHEFPSYETNAVVELCALELGARVGFDAIVSYSETDMIRAARCRAALGLPGQSVQSAVAFRDKLDMRERCAAAGLPGPAFAAVTGVESLLAFVAEQGYPVVIKPRLSTAARAVVRVDDEAELADFLVDGLYTDIDVGPPLMVEGFVAGQLYAVDLLVVDGELVHVERMRYVNTCLDYSSGASRSVGCAQISAEHPDAPGLDAFCRALLEALPHPGYGGFHVEAFVRPEGEVVLCEVASRSGGAGIPQLIERSVGFNPDRATTLLQASLGRDRAWVAELVPAAEAFGFLLLAPGERGAGWALPSSSPPASVQIYEVEDATCEAVDDVAKFAAFALVEGASIAAMDDNLVALERWFYGVEEGG